MILPSLKEANKRLMLNRHAMASWTHTSTCMASSKQGNLPLVVSAASTRTAPTTTINSTNSFNIQAVFPSTAIGNLRSYQTYSSKEVQEVNKQLAVENSFIKIQTTPDNRGFGIYATRDIPKGTRIIRSNVVEDNGPIKTKHSLQTDWNNHMTMDMPAVLMNHSCHANVGVQPNEHGAYDFWSLESISMNDELWFDYESAEYEIEDFSCSCGTPNCRGVLKGFKYHGDEVTALYGEEFIAPYLIREEEEEKVLQE